MRSRLLLICALLSFATAGFAKDVYLSIGGTVGNFRTDARIFNPSGTKDITITAAFLPAGTDGSHPNNNGVASKTITLAKRTQVIYDDVVASLFQTSGLGAIRLSSEDDFVATQRIFANETSGTLGQFVPGLDVGQARAKGLLIHLKQNGARGTRGTYRTNIGFVNPANATTTVTLRLYGKNNALIGAAKTITMQPFGVIQPLNLGGFFGTTAADDTSDAWVSYEATNPIFAYSSILDNGTEDPTFIPASEDTGTTPTGPPPGPTQKTFNVTLFNFGIEFNPPLSGLKVNDQVTFRIVGRDATHGFQLVDPSGENLVPDTTLNAGQTTEKTFTVKRSGTHTYFCTRTTCGSGHGIMNGTFDTGADNDGPGEGRGY